MQNLGPIAWFAFVAALSVVAMLVLRRRGSNGGPFVIVIGLGALLSAGLLTDAFHEEKLIGVVGVVLALVGCFGLIPRRRSGVKCHACGYDLGHSAERGGARCPECGEPRPTMDGHCLECQSDIRSALAGGTIKCPVCGAPVGQPRT